MGKRLNRTYFEQPATLLAPDLIGKLLCRRTAEGLLKFRITETECYYGEQDTACHASRGKTQRTRVLYEQGGRAYVYLCYGMYSLFNVVTGKEGFPEAVLIRGVEGYNGPGKLTRAMEIDRTLNEADLTVSEALWLEDDGCRPAWRRARRVGIDYADRKDREVLWRFIIEDGSYRAAEPKPVCPLVYGTGNPAKLRVMKRALKGLPVKLTGLKEAFRQKKLAIPEVSEDGDSPLANARLKAFAYYEALGEPVFSCDSGLYLYDGKTGELLPEEVQPGIHIRGRGERRLTDEELLTRYVELVKHYGPVRARYQNAICLIGEEGRCRESQDESLWGAPFLLTDSPHPRRVPGFPIDRISLEIASGRYYYDLEGNSQDDLAAENGFRAFFRQYLQEQGVLR